MLTVKVVLGVLCHMVHQPPDEYSSQITIRLLYCYRLYKSYTRNVNVIYRFCWRIRLHNSCFTFSFKMEPNSSFHFSPTCRPISCMKCLVQVVFRDLNLKFNILLGKMKIVKGCQIYFRTFWHLNRWIYWQMKEIPSFYCFWNGFQKWHLSLYHRISGWIYWLTQPTQFKMQATQKILRQKKLTFNISLTSGIGKTFFVVQPLYDLSNWNLSVHHLTSW